MPSGLNGRTVLIFTLNLILEVSLVKEESQK